MTPKQIEDEQAAHHVRGNVCPDWDEFDNVAAPVLEKLAHDIYTGAARTDGRPERVSERLIYRTFELNGEKLHWYRLQNAPKCKSIMDKYYETYEDNWARRLVWAYHKLKKERGSVPFYWSDMRKISGVRMRNIEGIIPLIGNHTDRKTAKAIRQIIE